MHPSSPEQYFLLEQLAGSADLPVLQQSYSHEQTEENVASAGSPDAENQGSAAKPDPHEIEVGIRQVKAEAGSDAQPGEAAKVLHTASPAKAAVEAEHAEANGAADANGPMPSSDSGASSAAAHPSDAAVDPPSTSAASEQTTSAGSIPLPDVLQQAAAVPRGSHEPQPDLQSAGPCGESEAERVDGGPGEGVEVGPVGEQQQQAQLAQQARDSQKAPADRQPRLANGRFLPRKRQRPADPAADSISLALADAAIPQPTAIERSCPSEAGPAAPPQVEVQPSSIQSPARAALPEGDMHAASGTPLLRCALSPTSFDRSCSLECMHKICVEASVKVLYVQ